MSFTRVTCSALNQRNAASLVLNVSAETAAPTLPTLTSGWLMPSAAAAA